MRRFVFTAVLALLLSTTVAAGASSPTPSLRLLRPGSVLVGGKGFHARERVRLTLVAGELIRQVQLAASSSGTFAASLGPIPLGRCSSFTVRARGIRGETAVLRHVPLMQCSPVRTGRAG